MLSELKAAYAEAARRDKAAADKLREAGWNKDQGFWQGPDGETILGGPDDSFSVFRQLDQVLKERGIGVEDAAKAARSWLKDIFSA